MTREPTALLARVNISFCAQRLPAGHPRMACRSQCVNLTVLGCAGTRLGSRRGLVGLEHDHLTCVAREYPRHEESSDAPVRHARLVEQDGRVVGWLGSNEVLEEGNHECGHGVLQLVRWADWWEGEDANIYM